jgi:hypothetical protein
MSFEVKGGSINMIKNIVLFMTIFVVFLTTGCNAIIYADKGKEVKTPGMDEVIPKAFKEVIPGGVYDDGYRKGQYFLGKAAEDEKKEKYGVMLKAQAVLDDGSTVCVFTAVNTSLLDRIKQMIDRQEFIEHPPTVYLIIAKKGPKEELSTSLHYEKEKGEVKGGYHNFRIVNLTGKGEQLIVDYIGYIQTQDKNKVYAKQTIYDLDTGKKMFSAYTYRTKSFDDETAEKWVIDIIEEKSKRAKRITRQKIGALEIEHYLYKKGKYRLNNTEKLVKKGPSLKGSARAFYSPMLENPGHDKIEGEFKQVKIPKLIKVENDKFSDEEFELLAKAAYPEAKVTFKERVFVDIYGKGRYWQKKAVFVIEKNNNKKRILLIRPSKVMLENSEAILCGFFQATDTTYQERVRVSFSNANANKYTEAVLSIIRMGKEGNNTGYRYIFNKRYWIGLHAAFIQYKPDKGVFFYIDLAHIKEHPQKKTNKLLIMESWRHVFEITKPRLVLEIPCWARLWMKDNRGRVNDDLIYSGPCMIKWKDIDNDKVSDLIFYDDEDNMPKYVYKFTNGVFEYLAHGNIKFPEKKKYDPGSVNPEVEVTVQVKDEDDKPLNGITVGIDLRTSYQNILDPWAGAKSKSNYIEKVTDRKGMVTTKGKAHSVDITISIKGYEKVKKWLDPMRAPLPELVTIVLKKKEKK